MNLIIQAIGLVGMIMCLLCFHCRKHKQVLLVKLIADISWMIHYFLLRAFSGCAVNVICCIREIVYLFEKNEKRRYVWLTFFIGLNWISATLTWKGVHSILPTMVATLGAYSFWQKNVKITRIIGILTGTLMFTYDIFEKSYIGMLSESFTIVSATVALIRTKNIQECSDIKNEPAVHKRDNHYRQN